MRIGSTHVLLTSIVLISSLASAQQMRSISEQATTIKISVSVEGEGPGGLFAQEAEDLSTQQLGSLNSLLTTAIQHQLKNHQLVPGKEPEAHEFLSVVAAKVRSPGNRVFFVASSELSVGTLAKGGHLDSLTHDVIVEPTLPRLASAVAYYLSAIELRGLLGLIDAGPQRR